MDVDPDIIAVREIVINQFNEKYKEICPADNFEKRIIRNFQSMSDYLIDQDTRSLCIILSSFTEDTIAQLFTERWDLDSNSKRNNYFDMGGPLSTFSAKLLIAKGIGWLTEERYLLSNKLKKIRNTFSHSFSDHQFSSGKLKSMIDEIHKFEDDFSANEKFRNALNNIELEEKLKIRYYNSCSYTIIDILSRSKKINAQIPPEWRGEGYDGLMELQREFIDSTINFYRKKTGMI